MAMMKRFTVPRRTVLVVLLVLLPVAVLSVLLHRHGQPWGDDDALYLRQARSLVDGNIGQVIADNHVNVGLAAKPGFSPYVYPWTFPVLLAPFVRLWGLDFDKLKLVEVGCWVGFLACWFGLTRRRMTTWLALLTTAAAGYSLVYMAHTDLILSELPYMAALGATLWFIDTITGTGSDKAERWDAIDRRRLVVLGLMMMLLFNVRREGLAIVPAVLALQAVNVWPRRHEGPDWKALATPHVTFLGSVLALQLLLPSALAPSYDGAGLGQTWRKLRDPFQSSFVNQLGFDHLDGWLRAVLGLVIVVGVVVRIRRHARADIGFVVFAVVSMVIVGMIPADSGRYTMALTPFLAYFAIQACAAIPGSRALAGGAVAASLLIANVVDIPTAVRQARHFDRSGSVQVGPEQASSQEMFAAVRMYTHRDDLVAFFKARALTLFTDRRSVQSKDLAIILQRADWFVMGRSAPIGIPILTGPEVRSAGLVSVWSNSEWTLWRVPER